MNVWTPGLLKSHGIRYDSSLMGNDVPYDIATPEGPLTEIPVQWLMDDAPLFRHVYGATNAIADPGRVLQMWSREFVAMHRENGCFVLTCHPFISGRLPRGVDRGAGDVHAAAARRLVRHLRGGGALARPAWAVGAGSGKASAPGPPLIPPP